MMGQLETDQAKLVYEFDLEAVVPAGNLILWFWIAFKAQRKADARYIYRYQSAGVFKRYKYT